MHLDLTKTETEIIILCSYVLVHCYAI